MERKHYSSSPTLNPKHCPKCFDKSGKRKKEPGEENQCRPRPRPYPPRP